MVGDGAVPAGLRSSIEDRQKMVFLPGIRDVDDPLSAHNEQSVVDTGKICGIVPKTSVALHCHQRDLRDLGRVNHLRTAGLLHQPALLQLLHQGGNQGVVERLPTLSEGDVQTVEDLLEFFSADVAEHSPGRAGRGLPALQGHDLLPGPPLESLIIIESLLSRLVKRHQVRQRGPRLLEIGELVLQMLNQHTKLGPPVPGVVQAVHLMASKFQNAGASLPDYSGPQMADMHLLGDVRRGKIDHHPALRGGLEGHPTGHDVCDQPH
mmetsp:Transcript_49439/g.107952  ORF Transcript_49439/g.107952 Transcript_49439/m.107952 type:complete len:265 (-) Transcript_49439:267-1061(-)